MKKSFKKISLSIVVVGAVLQGGQLLATTGDTVQPDITVDTHLNFGAYTVTPIQLNQGESVVCDLKEGGITECENATPYGSFAQVGEFTITPGTLEADTDVWYLRDINIRIDYKARSVNLEEAGVALEFKFDGGTLPANTSLIVRTNTQPGSGSFRAFSPVVFRPSSGATVIGLKYTVDHAVGSLSSIAARENHKQIIKVYGKLTVSDPLKFFAYRTKHNIKDVSQLLGTLEFKVNIDDDALFATP